MSDQPWYAEGLAFTCTQCGNCCTGAPGVVWVSEEEMHAIAKFRGQSYGEIMLLHTKLVAGRRSLTEFANGDCTFLDPKTRSCTIYPVRPIQCRTWPFWPSNLVSPEAWQRAKTVCPGMDQGAFVSLESIERQAAEIDP
ncbi:YkgJ family cysteine cluster protein [bacterium]|nr:YkgJ family cysteine cluster protein [bacterium]